MKKMNHFSQRAAGLLAVFACSAMLLISSNAEAADTIKRLEGPDVRGTIVGMNPAKVTIDTNPVKEEVSVGDIDYISYDDEPNDLTQARLKVRNGQYGPALEQLSKIDVSTVTQPEIIQDIQFYFAKSQAMLALGGSGEVDARTAGGNLAKFTTAHPGSYHILEANLLIGDLVSSAGSIDNAMKYYETAMKAPWESGKLQAQLSLAQAYQRQNDWAHALPLYQEIANSNASGAAVDRIKLTAKLGEAAALAGTGKLEEGLKIVKDVIITAEKGDYALHGRAYNTLGSAYQAAQKPKDALLAYLHTDVLYFQDAENHAEALANLAQLWAQVSKPQRQQDAQRRLKTMYPGSRWANK